LASSWCGFDDVRAVEGLGLSFANNHDIRIHYETEGQGPPLVMLHGFAGSVETWREFGYVQGLADRFKVVLVDARGHGQSDKPHDPESYDLGLMATDLVAVLDDLGIEKAHFLGYSMGGRIGLRIAARGLLSRFRSLTIGGASPYPPGTEVARESSQRVHAATLKGAEAVAAWFEAQGGPLPPAERARILANDMQALVALRTQPMAPPGPVSQVNDYLRSISVSCLIYVGTADAYCEPASEAAGNLPECTLARIPGLNHIETYFRSELVLPHLGAFLARVG
jgi:pimeloyl-ACP methyl ester carboxylesterase